ncbi:MAG: reverse transcriptase domain-containing protein [Nanoarchaeota archaeon]|nr:reverse transcriptase domain-containing protein [Nanoarchaeota archaeon]
MAKKSILDPSRFWHSKNQSVKADFCGYVQLCSYKNLELAFKNARKGKTQKQYVIDFEKDLEKNLFKLQHELMFHTYKPEPLQEFILRDPKTRKINRSSFRDRIVHHALCNIIMPLLEKNFIYDSYANRRGKGTFKAIERFDQFKTKVSHNFTRTIFVLKADIRHYFEAVDHDILISLLKKKISDGRILWLINRIISHYSIKKKKGMPLGNLTSQFFANVYLNELDQFAKHTLLVTYYIRYVDDFVIFSESKEMLQLYKDKIDIFLRERLALELHPDKSKIIPLHRGVEFLGMKIFPHHKRIKTRNLRKFYRKFQGICKAYAEKEVDYDSVYEFVEGWLAYVKNANTYTLRKKVLVSIEQRFPTEISTKEVNRGRKEQRKRINKIIAEIKRKKK